MLRLAIVFGLISSFSGCTCQENSDKSAETSSVALSQNEQSSDKIMKRTDTVAKDQATSNQAETVPTETNVDISKFQTYEDVVAAQKTRSPEAEEKIALFREDSRQYAGAKAKLPDPNPLFGAHCARCHGVEARGDGPDGDELGVIPTNLREWQLKYGESMEELVYTIKYGQNDGQMPGFDKKLSDDEIWSLAHLVQDWLSARAEP